MSYSVSRREFLAASALVLGQGCTTISTTGTTRKRPPNIIVFLIDDLGWKDVGCYGGDLFETPNIDRLAREGMRFTDAYANCPVCSPSRAALMTGKNPARLAFTGHIPSIEKHRHPEKSRFLPPDDNLHLPLGEVTLAEALKPAGYVSGSFGKWHLGKEGYWPEHQGFDVNKGGWTHGSPPDYFDPYENPEKEWNAFIPNLKGRKEGEYLTDRLTDEAIQFIRDNQEQPFFCYLTHYAVHTPLQAPEALVEKYRAKLDGKDTPIDPVYAAMVENMDANIGRVLDAVRELHLEDDTLIVFTSDNGGQHQGPTTNAPLREGKGYLYEGGIRVPLIVKWPGHVPAGVVRHEPTIGTDLYPTILELADGTTAPGAPLDGISLADLCRGGTTLKPKPLIWYYPHYHKKRPGAAIRKGNFKLIEYYDPEGVELYDLNHDLSETTNLATARPEKARELLDELHQYLDRVNAVRMTPNPDWDGEK